VNRSTGFTPNMMMLGREVTTPAQLMFPGPAKKAEELEDYVSCLQDKLQRAHAVALDTLKTSIQKAKKYYDRVPTKMRNQNSLTFP